MNSDVSNMKICKKVKQEIEKYCDDYVKYHLTNFPKNYSSEEECRKEAFDFFVNEYSQAELLECPIKTAKEFFEKVNEDTITEALNMISFTYDYCDLDICKHAGYSTEMLYLMSHCTYYKDLMQKSFVPTIKLEILANLIQTFNMTEQVFSDCLDFISGYDKSFDKQKCWEAAKNLSKGQSCRHFCSQKIQFDNFNIDENLAVEDVD